MEEPSSLGITHFARKLETIRVFAFTFPLTTRNVNTVFSLIGVFR